MPPATLDNDHKFGRTRLELSARDLGSITQAIWLKKRKRRMTYALNCFRNTKQFPYEHLGN
jgi:hypothetical protein